MTPKTEKNSYPPEPELEQHLLQIREYQPSDKPTVIKYMEALWDYLGELDDLKRIVRKPKYGQVMTEELLEKVKNYGGKIFIAQEDEKPIGFASCHIIPQTEIDRLGGIPVKDGRISKLYVEIEYRRRGTGKKLMQTTQNYLREQGCTITRVEVFAPNSEALRFYQGLGYKTRIIDMVKEE